MARLLIFGLALLMLSPPNHAQSQEPAPGIATGPAIGDKLPVFEAVDQSGNKRSFDSLKGPNGLLLLFHRSADW